MAKAKTVWTCGECGFEQSRWSGQCPNCGAWNTLREEIRRPEGTLRQTPRGVQPRILDLSEIPAKEGRRIATGIGEFDRVLGGGIVPGAVVLAGGEPGVGKSTLLLQAAQKLAAAGRVLYVSGEESPAQIRLRAHRLGINAGISLLAETDLGTVLAGIREVKPQFLIVDSIQTLQDGELSGAPGSVSQVRACAAAISRAAREQEMTAFLVGHVTKEGAIAGPRVIEHLADAVLYFESERNSLLRVLRAVKNRFGSTDEIGLFEMRGDGMQEMRDTAFLFASDGPELDGTAIFCATQGDRPILLEIQALCARAQLGTPRRTASGIDINRLLMLCAVLDRKLGFSLHADDVFINVTGGIRIRENAADLAAAVAIVSSLRGRAVAADTAFIGEIGLAGEVRGVGRMNQRLSECRRLGMRRVLVPRQGYEKRTDREEMEIVPVSTVFEALEKVI